MVTGFASSVPTSTEQNQTAILIHAAFKYVLCVTKKSYAMPLLTGTGPRKWASNTSGIDHEQPIQINQKGETLE
jgi:hypothetical protein